MKNKKVKFVWLILTVVSLLFGGGYTLINAIAGVLMLAWLCWYHKTQGKVLFYLNDGILGIFLVVLGYCLTCFWAQDRGMAPWGIARFFPLLIYALVLMQINEEEREDIYAPIPFIGVVMTILSSALQFVPMCAEMFAPKGRLAGTLEYPNTYALFLLIGIIVLDYRKKPVRYDLACKAVLIYGILASGSRTSFLLLIVILMLLLVKHKNWKKACQNIGVLVICLITAQMIERLGGSDSGNRYLTTTSEASTLLCRLLYYKDALPVILHHPFGMGYMGYSAIQSSIQTGVYSVRYVHNELLQMLLDIGWIPTLGLCVALGIAFFRRGTKFHVRLMLFTILAHCMMDFDLQYLIIWMLLLPCLPLTSGQRIVLNKIGAMAVVTVILLVASLWLGAGELMFYGKKNDTCLAITPFNTRALERKLSSVEETTTAEVYAKRVLQLNPSSSLAHGVLAIVAYGQGDIPGMIEEEEAAISLAPYEREQYLDYFDRLYEAMKKYETMGDTDSALQCRARLLKIPMMLEEVAEMSDDLAWKLEHKPELTLPGMYLQRINMLEG